MDEIFWKGKRRPITPALLVVIEFGGLVRLADALGKRPSTVQRWLESGFIPPRYQGEILAVAAKLAIALDPLIFVPAAASSGAIAGDLNGSEPPLAAVNGESVALQMAVLPGHGENPVATGVETQRHMHNAGCVILDASVSTENVGAAA